MTTLIPQPNDDVADKRALELFSAAGVPCRVVHAHHPYCECDACTDHGNGPIRSGIYTTAEVAARWDAGVRAGQAADLKLSTPEGTALRIAYLRGDFAR